MEICNLNNYDLDMNIKRILGYSSFMVFLLCFTTSANAQNLDSKQQSIVSIASLTAKGDLDKLKTALNTGLEAGLTVNEIKEVLVHLYAYCGFPRSIRGLQTFMQVLDESKDKGISDNIGNDASPIDETSSKYKRGKKILGELTQTPQPDTTTGYSAFSPAIDTFLKEHLFADIFERDVLNYQQRELTTVSALIALGNVEPMLRSHLKICIIQGFTKKQMEDLVETLKPNLKRKKIKSAKKIIEELEYIYR